MSLCVVCLIWCYVLYDMYVCVCMYVHMYIYTHICIALSSCSNIVVIGAPPAAPGAAAAARSSSLGAKDCTPEINSSEIIVDFQWRCPMGFQWHFPTEIHFSGVCFQRIVTCPVDVYWNCPMDFHGTFQWMFIFVNNSLPWVLWDSAQCCRRSSTL